MEDITLVIMAAGIGSRYGKGVKQLAPVGPSGEFIMDYSIHDALEAGFQRIVFIIRRDLEDDFKQQIGNRIEALCPVEYVYQSLEDLPDGYQLLNGRTKPWGTGQAVWACRSILNGSFVVINADDYYGKNAFIRLHRFLLENQDASTYCMAGFILKNTLSEFGGVTRGICKIRDGKYLKAVEETKNIRKGNTFAYQEDTGKEIEPDTLVSMNMWGFKQSVLPKLEKGFSLFLEQNQSSPTAEYLLPIEIDALLQKNEIKVEVLDTPDSWFGITYPQDLGFVKESFQKLVSEGVYTTPLNGRKERL